MSELVDECAGWWIVFAQFSFYTKRINVISVR